MSDMITERDPVTTWADTRPTTRPLAALRQKVELAWQMYDQAVDGCNNGLTSFEAVVFQAEQAELLQAQLDEEYRKLNAPVQDCTCCLPEQICDACRVTGNQDELPY